MVTEEVIVLVDWTMMFRLLELCAYDCSAMMAVSSTLRA